jgi:transglutaminase-like putative cysteine protease
MSRPLGAFDSTSPAPVQEHEGRFRPTPEEGWTTLLALLVMLVTAAFAIDDANWTGYGAGSEVRQTAFLPVAILLAALTGFLLAKSRLSTVAAHFIGASLGAMYLLFAVSSSISQSPGVQQRVRDLTDSIATFVNDVVGLGLRSAETSVFLLILGALVWSAGQFAAFSIFRRGRPLPAIGIATTLLLINMSITVQNQYLHLVILATVALWLLVRMNMLQQLDGWRARRIGDGGYVSELFLRSGAVFVVLAIVGSLTLAANASSAPLQRAWRDADDHLLTLSNEVNRWVGGVSGPARGPNNLFSPTQVLRDSWESSNEPVFTATTSDGRPHYWRLITYDLFNGVFWDQSDRQSVVVAPGEALLAGTYEAVTAGAADRREVISQVTSIDLARDGMVAPEAPYAVVDRAVEVLTTEVDGNFRGARAADGLNSGDTYTVASLVRRQPGEEGALTVNQLASAGVDYSATPWAQKYIAIHPGSIGDRVHVETKRIVQRLPAHRRNPYHIALAVQDYLRDDGFTYTTNMNGVCVGELYVDCFLRVKRGFCERFATAMVMMLRTQQIPARYVVGYLPGKPANGVWNVDRTAAHAWVEVFFPTYGWVRFDPTPGNQDNGQVPTRLEPGAPLATPAAGGGEAPVATPNFNDGSELDPRDDERFLPGALPPQSAGGGDLSGPLALAGALLLLVALLFLASLRRLPLTEPDLAYRSVARIATRFGHGPRPTQTAYEFADGLGELVPAVRSDLHVVATAKVEAAYGRRQPDTDSLQLLRQAYRRVRIGLLRLLVRRPQLPRRPRGT